MYQPHQDGFSEAMALPWQFGNTSLPRDVTKSIFQYGRLVKSLNRTVNGDLPLFTQYLSTEKEKTIISSNYNWLRDLFTIIFIGLIIIFMCDTIARIAISIGMQKQFLNNQFSCS